MDKIIHLLKSSIKIALAFALYYAGILLLLKRIKLKNKAVVLMFHRVLPHADRIHSLSTEGIIIEPDKFQRRISFLAKHFKILTVSDFEQHFSEGAPFQNGSCLITFDDGWRDNFQYAFPILKKSNAPAVIFIPTNYIETGKLFWQEVMGHGFQQMLNSSHPETISLLHKHRLSQFINRSEFEKTQAIIERVRHYKALPYEEIDQMIEQQKSILKHDINVGDVDTYLTWQQMKQMQEADIAFGSHACSHRVLTRLSPQEIAQELTSSKEAIRNALGFEPTTIAYPNGDYSSLVGKITEATGYKVGFGTKYGLVSHTDDRFDLKRINMSDKTASSNPVLLATILGLF